MSAAYRELLELAAKAAGYAGRVEYSGATGECMFAFDMDTARRTGRSVWAPHEDDGDALRLAFTLKINIRHVGSNVQAIARDHDGVLIEVCDIGHVAGEAGLRRVIVMAAAAIGKAMP